VGLQHLIDHLGKELLVVGVFKTHFFSDDYSVYPCNKYALLGVKKMSIQKFNVLDHPKFR